MMSTRNGRVGACFLTALLAATLGPASIVWGQDEAARRAELEARRAAAQAAAELKAGAEAAKRAAQEAVKEAAAPADAPAKPDKPEAPPADETPAPKPPIDPEMLRVLLMDGSLISGKFASKELTVETEFGKLVIPVASIRSFTPGLGSHPQVAQNLGELIEKLGSAQFGEREAAQKALVQMGPSIRPQLERVANDTDTERKSRAQAILEEFDQLEQDAESSEEGPAAAAIERDTVETIQFTVVGKIAQEQFEIISRYGPLNVKLADIRRVERDAAVSNQDLRKTVLVDGTNLIHRGVKDSGIRIARGDKVMIVADGTLTMTPWGEGAVSTPDGGQNFGFYMPSRIPGGTLIARLGPTGQVFKVGSRHTFTATKAGVLQFAIAMQNDYANQAFPGEYKVRVTVKKK